MQKLLFVFATILIVHQSHAQPAKVPSDTAPIRNVLSTFMRSIIQKDTTTLAGLFADAPIAWVNVKSKETFAEAIKRNPHASVVASGTHKEFITFVGTTKGNLEEKFYNVNITKGEYLASVTFDYSFWDNSHKMNWGQEQWELMYNGTAWKIVGVYWSINLDSLKKEPGKLND